MELFDRQEMEGALERASALPRFGRISQVVGLVVQGHLPGARVGSVVEIEVEESGRGGQMVPAEVVGFRGETALMMPLDELRGVSMGCRLRRLPGNAEILVGPDLLGRVIDGRGRPIDGRPAPYLRDKATVHHEAINPLQRRAITEPLDLGVKALNAFVTCGKGQRLGVMSGSGIGKSILLGMMARNTAADVTVLALIGERGREVRAFLEGALGEEGLRRSVVVVATSDQSPLLRLRGAFVATAVAEYFRARGADVLLLMDSLTRFAMAQREIGLAVGEPPTTKGYTPSVFALLPRLLERVGPLRGAGSITGLFTILAEGDDLADPIADATRALLDGHTVLSRDLAARGHYPAIDVLDSISRVMIDVVGEDHMQAAVRLRRLLAVYRDAEDLINIGAYQKGSNPEIDEAIERLPVINAFLTQGIEEKVDMAAAQRGMQEILGLPPRGGSSTASTAGVSHAA